MKLANDICRCCCTHLPEKSYYEKNDGKGEDKLNFKFAYRLWIKLSRIKLFCFINVIILGTFLFSLDSDFK